MTDNDKEVKTTSSLYFNGEDDTKWEAWSFKMLAHAAKKGCESAFATDLSAVANPDALTDQEKANKVTMEGAWATLALVVQKYALKSLIKVRSENPCEAWQKLKDEFEPSQIVDVADLQIEFSNMTFDSHKSNPIDWIEKLEANNAEIDTFKICSKDKPKSNQPSRDLRSILKMAVKGSTVRLPIKTQQAGAGAHVVGHKVMEVKPGLVESSGLLNVSLTAGKIVLPRVRTLFGGNIWVARPLTPAEILSAWDVPEKLGNLSGSDEGRTDLMSEPFTPLKIRQAVLVEAKGIFAKLNEPFDLINGPVVLPIHDRSTVTPRGAALRITSPEEERAISRTSPKFPVTNLSML
jgi:hypothetical protein